MMLAIARAGYESCWRVEKKSYENLVKNDFILWKKADRNGEQVWWPYVKYYLDGRTKRPSPLWMDLEGNKKASRELRDLFDGKKVFDFPKPVDLIKRVIQISTKKDSLVVDFFSGAATTAQAVMELNAEKNTKLKYIMVQLPELCKEDSEAFKFFNFRTLDQVGMERIKRSSKKIKEKTGADIDYGFKHYTLVEPSDETIDKLEKFNPNKIFSDNNILKQFGRESVLETWLVKDGYGFGTKAIPILLNKYTTYHYNKHLYFIDSDFSDTDIIALIDKYNVDPGFNPENVVVFGYSFTFTQTEMLHKNLKVLKNGEKNLKINMDIRY